MGDANGSVKAVRVVFFTQLPAFTGSCVTVTFELKPALQPANGGSKIRGVNEV
jgi:hypothetical protein